MKKKSPSQEAAIDRTYDTQQQSNKTKKKKTKQQEQQVGLSKVVDSEDDKAVT